MYRTRRPVANINLEPENIPSAKLLSNKAEKIFSTLNSQAIKYREKGMSPTLILENPKVYDLNHYEESNNLDKTANEIYNSSKWMSSERGFRRTRGKSEQLHSIKSIVISHYLKSPREEASKGNM